MGNPEDSRVKKHYLYTIQSLEYQLAVSVSGERHHTDQRETRQDGRSVNAKLFEICMCCETKDGLDIEYREIMSSHA